MFDSKINNFLVLSTIILVAIMISTNILLLGTTNTIIQQSYAQKNNNTIKINNANDILAYQNPKYGMKMQYPLPWQSIELNRVMGWEQPVVPVRPYLSVVAITSVPKDVVAPVVAGNATATNASSTTIPSTINITNKSAVTSFQAARHQYLEAWNHTTFHSAFDVFIQQGSATEYGVYITHPPVFKPGDSIALYVEPVGYSFKQVIDEQGNSLNQVNLTADITITSNNGTQLTPPLNATPLVVTSHNKNTELFLTLRVDQNSPFPVGDYKIKYDIKDGSTGKSFQLVKSVKVANTVIPG